MSISKEKLHNINTKISGTITRRLLWQSKQNKTNKNKGESNLSIWFTHKIYPANYKSYNSLIFAPKKDNHRSFNSISVPHPVNLVLFYKNTEIKPLQTILTVAYISREWRDGTDNKFKFKSVTEKNANECGVFGGFL